MPTRLRFGIAAAAVLLAVTVFAAVPRNFVPDFTFQGSSLKGWHVLGKADWRAEKGELIGTPKGSGGWIVLDKSYQDVAFFASSVAAANAKRACCFALRKPIAG